MAKVDVVVEVEIAADPADVAAVMFDPAREKDWMDAVHSVDLLDPALAPGARVRHHGRFLGRALSWITEVETVHFPHVLSLRIGEGPFVGTVRYEIQRSPGGSHVRVRNVGEPGSLGFLPTALIEGPMRSAMAGDLERLKALVEA
jgi:Polyketide cyclase / dehydrase and lipid transport